MRTDVRTALVTLAVCAWGRVARGDPPVDPPANTPADRMSSLLADAPVVPAAEAAWIPFRLVSQLARPGVELPVPTAPSRADDRTVWTFVLPATPAPAPSVACATLLAAEPRVRCTTPTLTLNGRIRSAVSVGWRTSGTAPRPDLATPARALARLMDATCVRALERTAHTLEIEIVGHDLGAVGFVLGRLSAAPGMSSAMVVRFDPDAAGLRAQISWPTDGAVRDHGDMADDPWPPRCGNRVTVGEGAPVGSPLLALARIEGERARGAVVSLLRREWIVTEGDVLGDATVTSIDARGVTVRRRGGRTQVLPYATAAPSPASRAARARTRGRGGPVFHVQLPPEPAPALP